MPSVTALIIAAFVLGLGALLSVAGKKLTPAAGLSAFLVGAGIFLGAGIAGLCMLALFFALATLATAHKKNEKAKLEMKRAHPERRKAGQVFANGGVAAALGLLSPLFPEHYELIAMMIAAAISAATADTLASELGMVYGRNAFNILTFKKEPRGLDGVISIEGTLLGIAGSLMVGGVYGAFMGFEHWALLIIVLAGTVGNIADSLLGALLERKHMINNNIVNTLNTLTGALVAWLLFVMI